MIIAQYTEFKGTDYLIAFLFSTKFKTCEVFFSVYKNDVYALRKCVLDRKAYML